MLAILLLDSIKLSIILDFYNIIQYLYKIKIWISDFLIILIELANFVFF